MKTTNTVIVCTAGVGFVVFVASIAFGWFAPPAIIVQMVKQNVLLVNGTEAYERWRKLPVALQLNFYLFNVTNPDDVQNGANPVVQEIGPYVYDEYREKFDIKDYGDGTLSYLQNTTFYFNKKKSGNLSEDDVVTVLNLGLVGTVLKAQRYISPGTPLDPVLSEIFHGSDKIFQTATVGDLTFRGVNAVNCTVTDQMSSEGKMICGVLKSLLPATVAEHEPGIFKMAYFRHKNNTNDGRYRINSGIYNAKALGRIEEWNGMPNLTFWSDSYCNTLNGTDATIFPPFCSPKDKLYIYLVDICRSLYADFETETMWKGLPAFRYVAGVHNFEAAKDFPPNICFCEDTGDESPECLESGVIDLYDCLGVSVIFSLPHLYNASPDYQRYVQGLNPNKKKHETFVEIEPETGTILRGYKRMQMNIFLKKTNDLNALSKVSEGLFPVLWVEEGCELDDKDLKPVYRLYTIICVLAAIKWLLVVGGVLLMCVSIYMFAFKRNCGHRVRENEDTDRNVVVYDNKAYGSKRRDMNDALSISTLSDINRTDHIDIRKRWGNFPDKSSTSFEPNKTSDNVGLGVYQERNKDVTLSNVFM